MLTGFTVSKYGIIADICICSNELHIT